mgnify:FL=1|tara:strand:- start:360 stop:584 length:225 start_codon:yes stop_codon:yes gene_type:complete
MWNKSREIKRAYVVMKLDMMLAQHREIGIIDIDELHAFIAQFRHLDQKRQKMYAWMVDEMAELWDAFDEVDFDV